MLMARGHLFYGSYLTGQSRFEDAEAELMMAAEIMGGVECGTHPTHPHDILRECVTLYEAWDRPDKAAEYRGMLSAR